MSDSVKKYYENKQDKIVENVIGKYRKRSKLGIEKYNTTLEDSKESLSAFVNHLQEELFDGSLYCETIIHKTEKMEQDIDFLRAQNEIFKEKIASLSNEVIVLRAAIEKYREKINEKNI